MTGEDDKEDGPTAEEFAVWLRPRVALTLRGSTHDHSAVYMLLNRLKAGRIRCAAETAEWTYQGEKASSQFAPFPRQWWDKVEVENAYEPFWTDAVSDLTITNPRAPAPIYFFDLRLEPQAVGAAFGLSALSSSAPGQGTSSTAPVPAPAPPARAIPYSSTLSASDHRRMAELESEVAGLKEALAAKSQGGPIDLDSLPPKRGRPAAEFWEDLIIEIARRMHLGDFKPQTQVEVEDAMERWILDRGYKGGKETQIKERARKVFRTFKD